MQFLILKASGSWQKQEQQIIAASERYPALESQRIGLSRFLLWGWDIPCVIGKMMDALLDGKFGQKIGGTLKYNISHDEPYCLVGNLPFDRQSVLCVLQYGSLFLRSPVLP